MPEKILPENETSEAVDQNDEAAPSTADQKSRSYYYDDACGYEVFDPDFDPDEEESKN